MARLMRPGARGGWVNGSLTWSGLDSWQVQKRRVSPRSPGARPRAARRSPRPRGTRRLLLQLRRRQDARSQRLRQPAAVVAARRGGPARADARPRTPGTRRGAALSARRAADRRHDPGRGGSLVRAVLRVDGEDADGLEPLLFLGSSGHGVVCAERGDVTADRGVETAGGCGWCASPDRRRRRCSGWLLDGERARGSRQASSTASPTSSARRCAASPRWCRRTARSPRRRSPRRRSCCAQATAPSMRSRSGGSGPTGSARTTRRAPLGSQRGGSGVSRSRRRARDPRRDGPRRDGSRALRVARRRGTTR